MSARKKTRENSATPVAKSAAPATSGPSRNPLALLLSSPVLWGGLLTVAFYQLIPYLPVQRELAERYFCSHPLEYATATLFFIGMAILAAKGVRVTGEKAAFEERLLELGRPPEDADPATRAGAIEQGLANTPSRLQSTWLGRRVQDVCTYVRVKKSGDGLADHLRYLAELAGERLHDSYALVRTITWAVPIIGFLGTVIGITIAIANVTPEQLDTSLTEVTGGLAVAFDTTALALALSLVMVFSSFLVERSEQQILSRVEDFGIRQIVPMFPPSSETGSPLLEAESKASQLLLDRTEALIGRQTELWNASLEELRTRWSQTMEAQTKSLDEAVQTGLSATLNNHDAQLAEIRTEFLNAFRSAAESITTGVNEFRAGQETTANQFASSMEELRRQGEVLLKIVAHEEDLARLQTRLNDNLESLRATESFEETIHSLTAAVHLMTAGVRSRAA